MVYPGFRLFKRGLSRFSETGSLIKDYIWSDGMMPVAQIDNNSGSEDIIYLTTDHLMTARIATDSFQSIVWRWEGEAFGNTPTETSAGITVNLRFPGQYFDEETNLHYNHFRYYDSNLGRYITSDPIGLDGGLSTYSYAHQNSIRLYDPDGKVPIVPVVIGIARAGAALCARYPKACRKALKCARNPIKCAKKAACGPAFQKAKHFACDVIGGSCQGVSSCMRILKRQAGNKTCLAMRRFELRVCFRNRDFGGGHRTRIRNVENRIKKCNNKLKCCTPP